MQVRSSAVRASRGDPPLRQPRVLGVVHVALRLWPTLRQLSADRRTEAGRCAASPVRGISDVSGGRRGATNSVLRSIGLDNTAAVRNDVQTEVARCPLCKSPLSFSTDVLIGRTIERCTGSGPCPNRQPHPPVPDPAAMEQPPKGFRTTRRRRGSTSVAAMALLVLVAIGIYVAGIFTGFVLVFVGSIRLVAGVED